MSDPNAPNQYPGGPDERTTPAYDPNNPVNPYGPYDPRQAQPSGPYQQPDQGAPVPVSPSNPYGQPTAPSGGYPQYQQPYPPYQQPYPPNPQQAPSGAYGQPGGQAPAYPPPGYAGPYGQPLAPGQTGPQGQMGPPMGQYAPYSQTLPGYAQPGAPSQGGPYDPTVAGPTYPPSGPAPTPRRSLRGVWIGLSVVVILALIGGGAAYYFLNYLPTQAKAAVTSAATSFCADLTSQNYVSAYQATSATFQGEFTQAQFTQDFATLDKAEGTASACTGTLGFAYSITHPNTTATYSTSLTRSTQGALQGTLHLKQNGGAWKVDAIDTSLLGVNLNAIQATQAYCTALQGQDYTTAYSLLDPSLQAGTTASVYTTTEQLHDTINGKVTNCSITAVAQSNTDTNAGLTESITRANLAAQAGAVTLGGNGAKWLITQLATSAEGEDVGPYQVGVAFCADIANGNPTAAYALTSSRYQSTVTESNFVAGETLPAGDSLTCGTPDLTTYQVSGSAASLTIPTTLSVSGTGLAVKLEMTFVQEGGAWKVDNSAFV